MTRLVCNFQNADLSNADFRVEPTCGRRDFTAGDDHRSAISGAAARLAGAEFLLNKMTMVIKSPQSRKRMGRAKFACRSRQDPTVVENLE